MEKYEPIGVVGEGSYGVVLKCRHRDSGRSVAIKKFIDSEDDQNVRKIALREIRVLRKLRHENLVNLLEVFRRRKHLYLVFEFIDHTLLDEMESKSKGLEPEVARKYVYQILRGLGFCHDNNIIHRDVKPENVLVSKNGIVKLCDFGFARAAGGPGELLTDYVATRWYRAPELLVGDVAYGKEVDLWAVGCLFAEMMSGEPLFPGDSDIDQLFLIAQCLGRLARRHLSIMSRNSAFRGFQFPKSRHGSTASNDSLSMSTGHPKLAKLDSSGSRHSGNSNGHKGKLGSGGQRPTPLEKSVFVEMFPNWVDEAVVLLTLCLDPEPSLRPGCSALLRLPYFTHDNFPSRFINELNQKLQLEGRHPIPAYSTRKKRSILGNLQQGATNNSNSNGLNHTHSFSNLSKKNPVYQGRLNLVESQQDASNSNVSSTKYSETFSNSQKIPQLPKPQNQLDSQLQNHKFNKFNNLSRDSTFLVENKGVYSKDKNFPRRITGDPSQESRIPSLLGRKYSDDTMLKNGFFSNSSNNHHPTSKSTPNIVSEEGGSNTIPVTAPQSLFHKEKRFSNSNSQNLAIGQSQLSSIQTQQQPPRKFSYSFPPPEGKDSQGNPTHNTSIYMKDFGDENGNSSGNLVGISGSKIFQPLPVTTLTFNLGSSQNSGISGYHPYSLAVSSTKSPNSPYLNVSSYTAPQKRSPSPTPTPQVPRLKQNGENSSYFPHTHFSTNSNNSNGGGGGRYPVSFYQGNTPSNPKSLPVSVFGSSMVLKNHVNLGDLNGGGESSSSFLPRMTGKTFTSSGGSVKEEEGSLSNYSKSGTNSLPRRRDSFTNGNGKWASSTETNRNLGLAPVPKGVGKLSNGIEPLISSNSAPRHFSTYGTQ